MYEPFGETKKTASAVFFRPRLAVTAQVRGNDQRKSGPEAGPEECLGTQDMYRGSPFYRCLDRPRHDRKPWSVVLPNLCDGTCSVKRRPEAGQYGLTNWLMTAFYRQHLPNVARRNDGMPWGNGGLWITSSKSCSLAKVGGGKVVIIQAFLAILTKCPGAP
jgi:hypothetical protein